MTEFGLDVPYSEVGKYYKQLVTDLQGLTGQEDREQIQAVLDRIKRSFLNYYKKEYKAYCISIRNLCREAGLHITGSKGDDSLIVSVLDSLGIAHGVVFHEVKSDPHKGFKRTNFILAAQSTQVIAGLIADERLKSLRINPVSQMSGQKLDQLPTTWQLAQKEGYEKLGVLLKNLGLPAIGGGNKITPQKWLDGCPVVVVTEKSHRSYYYPTGQEEQLKAFLQQRYQVLRNFNSH